MDSVGGINIFICSYVCDVCICIYMCTKIIKIKKAWILEGDRKTWEELHGGRQKMQMLHIYAKFKNANLIKHDSKTIYLRFAAKGGCFAACSSRLYNVHWLLLKGLYLVPDLIFLWNYRAEAATSTAKFSCNQQGPGSEEGNKQIPTEGYLNFLVNFASTSSPSTCFQESPVHRQRSQSCEPVNKPTSSRCGPLITRL